MSMPQTLPEGNVNTVPAGAPLIVLRNVRKIYGKGPGAVAALDGIDLTIRAGEFVAVLGPSGSGKSTAMNILGCLDTPTSGEYFFKGVNVASLSRDERAMIRRYSIGFVFQGFNLLKRTSALENLELPLVYRGLAAGERKARAVAALARVGLTGWEDHTAAELSGGQQQRVAIARALAGDPEAIFADEPTGNLDRARGHEIMKLLSSLNKERGITIVVVTHDEEMANYAQRHVRFLDGRIASDTRAAP